MFTAKGTASNGCYARRGPNAQRSPTSSACAEVCKLLSTTTAPRFLSCSFDTATRASRTVVPLLPNYIFRRYSQTPFGTSRSTKSFVSQLYTPAFQPSRRSREQDVMHDRRRQRTQAEYDDLQNFNFRVRECTQPSGKLAAFAWSDLKVRLLTLSQQYTCGTLSQSSSASRRC